MPDKCPEKYEYTTYAIGYVELSAGALRLGLADDAPEVAALSADDRELYKLACNKNRKLTERAMRHV